MKLFAAVSQVFDPRCMFELIEFLLMEQASLKPISENVEEVKQVVYDWFTKFSHNQRPATSSNTTQYHSNQATMESDTDEARFKQFLASKKTRHAALATAELDLY